MNFKQLQTKIAKKRKVFFKYIDDLYSKRVIELVGKLKHFKIYKLYMGMGSFSISGEDFDILYDDHSVGKKEAQELIYYYESYNIYKKSSDYCWEPLNINDHDSKILIELVNICNCWILETGGIDIDFTTNDKK